MDVEIPVSQFPLSVIAIVRVCFLNSSEIGLLGSGRVWRLVCLLGKNSEVAHLLEKNWELEILISEYRKVSSRFLSLPFIFYRVLIWFVFFIF